MNSLKRTLFLLLIATCFSSLAQADEIVITQKDQISSTQQLFPIQLIRTDGETIKFEDTFLLGSSFTYNQQEGVKAKLEASKKRELLQNHEETLSLFWNLFEKRAQELGMEINTDITKGVFPYESNVYENLRIVINPIQIFLIEQMGFASSESKELYSNLQVGYRIRGLEGAKEAFESSLKEMLRYEIIFLAGQVVMLSEVLAIKLQDELLQQHSSRSDKSSRFADLLITIVYGDGPHPARALILQMLKTQNVPLENKDLVRQFLIDNLDALLSTTQSSSLMSVLLTKEDRYRSGIEAEKHPTGVLHANGPMSVRANINKRTLEVIRLKGLLGETWGEANGTVNAILENSSLIIEKRHEDILGLVKTLNGETHAGLSCRSLL